MVVGSSVSRKQCDEVFLQCHIWSLDRQCHGNNVTKLSWSAIYGRWIVCVTENMWRSFPKLLLGTINWVARGIAIWIEKHCLGAVENCIDSAEKKKCQKKGKWDYLEGESITGNLCIQNHVPTTLIPHACMHAFSGSPFDAVSICLVILSYLLAFVQLTWQVDNGWFSPVFDDFFKEFIIIRPVGERGERVGGREGHGVEWVVAKA